MTYDAQCMPRVLTGFFSKRWKAASQSACGHAKAVSPSAVMYVSHHAACLCGMRHGIFLRRERVRSRPGASGDLGLVRACRAFVRFVRFICEMPGRKVTLSCGRGLASKRAASSCHKIPLW